MLWMITKFIFCLLAAGALGFIAGWILSSLIKNEKQEEKYSLIKDDLDTQRAELNQTFSDLDAKEHDLSRAQQQIQQLDKELLIRNMDLEEFQKNGYLKSDNPEYTELTLENNTLKEEISEYKYLENENDLLHNEIKELAIEKEKLMVELDGHRSGNGKTQKTTVTKKLALKDRHVETLQNELKKSQKSLKRMKRTLGEVQPKMEKIKTKKQRKKDDNKPLIFGFKKDSDNNQPKK